MSFFYNEHGDFMKIYVDLVLMLNFGFDFLLLLTTSVLLKRKVKGHRLLLGAFIGSLSTLLLFFSFNSLTLFILKVFISVFMILTSFGYRDKKYFFKNISYLYMLSIILGGFLYFLNVQFSYKNEGLIFYHHGLSINVWLLLILSPIILIIYIKQNRNIKNHYQHYHQVKIYLKNENIECVGYLDTGNQLVDPYFRRSVVLLNKQVITDTSDFTILVPYQTIGNKGFIYCTSPLLIEVDGKKCDALVGISHEYIAIEGVDCILPNKIGEKIC